MTQRDCSGNLQQKSSKHVISGSKSRQVGIKNSESKETKKQTHATKSLKSSMCPTGAYLILWGVWGREQAFSLKS